MNRVEGDESERERDDGVRETAESNRGRATLSTCGQNVRNQPPPQVPE